MIRPATSTPETADAITADRAEMNTIICTDRLLPFITWLVNAKQCKYSFSLGGLYILLELLIHQGFLSSKVLRADEALFIYVNASAMNNTRN